MALEKRKNLGRGLSALIPPRPAEAPTQVANSELALLPMDQVLPSDGQPRQVFDETGLEELASSIRQHGILQPIVVRRRAAHQYEIVAGERRWRAAQRAGLDQIKAVISDVAEKDTLTLALVENIQRRDLNPIEEAEAFQRLHAEMGFNQSDIAKAVGKDRATVANALRLLKLPQAVQQLVLDGVLTMGHARALLSLNEPKAIEKFAGVVQKKGWNVRQTEKAVQEQLQGPAPKKAGKKAKAESQNERDVRMRLQRAFGTKVELDHAGGKGFIKVHFASYDELDAILAKVEHAH